MTTFNFHLLLKSLLVSLFYFPGFISILLPFLVTLFLVHWNIQHITESILLYDISLLSLVLSLDLQLSRFKTELLKFSQSSFFG